MRSHVVYVLFSRTAPFALLLFKCTVTACFASIFAHTLECPRLPFMMFQKILGGSYRVEVRRLDDAGAGRCEIPKHGYAPVTMMKLVRRMIRCVCA